MRDEKFAQNNSFAAMPPGWRERASFATNPLESRGRLIDEPQSRTRTPFQRDRDRIIHSTAFRRLKHKTQVFVYHEGDHYRTRLTHTIEVSQIARSLARAFHVDEDLAEALALVHDFGHTPFGHAGERALNECMADYGGFDHNAQSLRIVTSLEKQYASFDGLNLCWETLEGLAKHNGPLLGKEDTAARLPLPIAEYAELQDLQLWSWPGLEAQLAAIADDIAYDNHDIDDGLRAGLFLLDDLGNVPLVGELLKEVRELYPDLETGRTIHELIRRQITVMVEDVIDETQRRVDELLPSNVEDIRQAGRALSGFSEPMAVQEKALKAFLFKNMYRHDEVMRVMQGAETIVRDLFWAYFSGRGKLPEDWAKGFAKLDDKARARRVADFIAGQSDPYAISEHRRLFDATPDLG
jgi:dGTPase